MSKKINKFYFNDWGAVLKVILFMTLLGVGVYSEGTGRSVFLIISLLYFLMLGHATSVICLLCHTVICDSLFIVPSVSYGSIVIILFILKGVVGKRVFFSKPLLSVFFILGLQFLSVVIFDNELINVIRFTLNLLILAFFYTFSFSVFKRKDIVPIAVSYTILIGGLISINMSYSVDDIGIMRFSGIWNDENFCGMYCLLGIISSIYAIIYNKWNAIIAIPAILISMYMETLTMSRTFIYVMAFVSLFMLYVLLKNKSVNPIIKILVSIIMVILVVVVYDRVVSSVMDARGLVSSEGGWTNNRGLYSGESLKAFWETPLTWLMGCGISNCVHLKEMLHLQPYASHNTYVDMLVEMGIPITFAIISYIITYVIGSLKSITKLKYYDILCLTVMLYMGTLSLGQYSFLYIIFGIMLNRITFNKNSNLNMI